MALLDTYLNNFGCDQFSTVDQIKTAFRKLAQKHHPDHGGNAKNFIEVKKQYEYLLANHKPKIKLDINVNAFQSFFRILDKKPGPFIVTLPELQLSKDTKVFFMMGVKEFTITLRKGVSLPLRVRVTDKAIYKHPFEIEFKYQRP